ncbi:MAG: cation:proton antiporter [Candidatus Sericytochromatia bacterium]
MNQTLVLLLELLFAVTIVSVVARRLNFPYTTALVVTGLALSYFGVLPDVRWNSEIILNLFLPILLFEGAISSDASRLKEVLKPAVLLATVGVVIMALGTATVLHLVLGFPMVLALLVGTMLAPTDTISVLAVFKNLRVPPRLSTMIESESLFNDGTAIVMFKVVLAVVLTGVFHPVMAGFQLVIVFTGGILLGGLLGLFVSWVLSQTEDHLTEILLSTLLALGAFFLAESIGVSGVIAVVAAGLVVGNYGWKRSLAPTSQIALGSFWEYAAFGVNSIIFLLVGLSLDLPALAGSVPVILIGFLAVAFGRVVLIYGGFLLGRLTGGQGIPAKWQHIMVLGNIKGSLTMVLALSLPETTPMRDEILTMTFGIVLFSLVVQGLTLGPIVKALRVMGVPTLQAQIEKEQLELIRSRAAQAELQKLLEAGLISKSSHERMRARYQVSIAQAERELRALATEHQAYWDEAFDEVRRRLLVVEKAAIVRAMREKLVSDEVAAEALLAIDSRIVEQTTAPEQT